MIHLKLYRHENISRALTFILIMHNGKRKNKKVLHLNTNFWKIENFELMLVVHNERHIKRQRERDKKKKKSLRIKHTFEKEKTMN